LSTLVKEHLPVALRSPLSRCQLRPAIQWEGCAHQMTTLERFYRYGLNVSVGAYWCWRHPDLSRQELTVIALTGKHDFVVGSWPPALGQCLTEAVDQPFCKGVECHRVEAFGMIAMA